MDPSEPGPASVPSAGGPGPDPPERRRVGLWAGLGCLGILVLSCCMLSYWAQKHGFRWVLNQNEEVRGYVSRGLMSAGLQGIAGTCSDGVPSDDGATWFHPDLPAEERNVICTVDFAVIQQIGSEEQAPAQTLTASGESDLAAEYQMSPDDCYRYRMETFSVVGCYDRSPDATGLPYRIIDVTTVPK